MKCTEKNLGTTILYHRKKSGLSRNELALLAGIGKTVIYDIEHGKVTIKLQTLLKILHILNITLDLQSPLMEAYEKSEHICK